MGEDSSEGKRKSGGVPGTSVNEGRIKALWWVGVAKYSSGVA